MQFSIARARHLRQPSLRQQTGTCGNAAFVISVGTQEVIERAQATHRIAVRAQQITIHMLAQVTRIACYFEVEPVGLC